MTLWWFPLKYWQLCDDSSVSNFSLCKVQCVKTAGWDEVHSLAAVGFSQFLLHLQQIFKVNSHVFFLCKIFASIFSFTKFIFLSSPHLCCVCLYYKGQDQGRFLHCLSDVKLFETCIKCNRSVPKAPLTVFQFRLAQFTFICWYNCEKHANRTAICQQLQAKQGTG